MFLIGREGHPDMCPSTCTGWICASRSAAEWCGGDCDRGGEEADVTWFPQVEETLALLLESAHLLGSVGGNLYGRPPFSVSNTHPWGACRRAAIEPTEPLCRQGPLTERARLQREPAAGAGIRSAQLELPRSLLLCARLAVCEHPRGGPAGRSRPKQDAVGSCRTAWEAGGGSGDLAVCHDESVGSMSQGASLGCFGAV